jgi:hypothetical protein
LLDLDSEAAVVVADESQLFDNNSDHPAETGAIQSAGSTEDVPSVDADIEAAKAKPVDVVTLQAQLLQAFEDEYASQGRVLGIHSATPCPHCGFTMLDEEVLSRWCHGHAYEAHIKGNTRSPQARNMVAVHKITCKQCSEEFQPQLHVSCYAKDGNITPESECSTPVSVAAHVPVRLQRLWAEEVSYLSPFGLRYEMESVLLQYGHTAFTTAWLHAHHPVLLWGILFYSCRVHLPSGLHHVSPANDFARSNGSEARSYLHPVVVGWRESTVKALASRVLTAKAYDFLTVRDIFPDCTEEDAAKLEQDVVPALDGSPAGMRIAMMEFSQCHSVMLYGQKAGFSAARLLNMGLLMMCYLYHQTHLTMPKHFDTLAHLDKVSFIVKCWCCIRSPHHSSSGQPPSNCCCFAPAGSAVREGLRGRHQVRAVRRRYRENRRHRDGVARSLRQPQHGHRAQRTGFPDVASSDHLQCGHWIEGLSAEWAVENARIIPAPQAVLNLRT